MFTTVQEILANMTQCGLDWVTLATEKKEGAVNVVLRTGPILVVTDVAKFRENVTNADTVIASALDGSSIRVQARAITKSLVLKDRKVSDDVLKHRQIESIIVGARAPRQAGPKTWKTPAGTFTDRTQAVAQTASWFIDHTNMDGPTAKDTAEKVVSAQD